MLFVPCLQKQSTNYRHRAATTNNNKSKKRPTVGHTSQTTNQLNDRHFVCGLTSAMSVESAGCSPNPQAATLNQKAGTVASFFFFLLFCFLCSPTAAATATNIIHSSNAAHTRQSQGIFKHFLSCVDKISSVDSVWPEYYERVFLVVVVVVVVGSYSAFVVLVIVPYCCCCWWWNICAFYCWYFVSKPQVCQVYGRWELCGDILNVSCE